MRRMRARERRRADRWEAKEEEGAEEDADAAFIAASDEDEEEAEAVSHLQLRHRMRMQDEGLEVEEEEEVRGMRGEEAAVVSTVLSSQLFDALSSFSLPLSLASAFRVYALQLTAVLVDAEVSRWLESLPSTARLMTAVRQKVEETFDSQRRQWVRSQLWEQGGRGATFLAALDRLPYASSSRTSSADLIDPDTGHRRPAPQCQACGRAHDLTHTVHLYGVPYDVEALQPPFDEERIFTGPHPLLPPLSTCTLPRAPLPPSTHSTVPHCGSLCAPSSLRCCCGRAVLSVEGSAYVNAEFRVGELCHMRCRLYHAMTHAKSDDAHTAPGGCGRPGETDLCPLPPVALRVPGSTSSSASALCCRACSAGRAMWPSTSSASAPCSTGRGGRGRRGKEGRRSDGEVEAEVGGALSSRR